MTTGAKHHRDLFVSQMQGHTFTLAGKDAIGNDIKQSLYGMLEPVELWRYVFPKEGLKIVTKTLNGERELSPAMKRQTWALRKAIGLKEIPRDNLPNVKLPVVTDHMQIVPVGIKEDDTVTFGNGNTHEAI